MNYQVNFRLTTVWYLTLVVLALTPRALAAIEVYGGLDVGSMLMREQVGGTGYTNQSTFFVGHWGYALGTRAKINLGSVGLGVIGEVAWIGDSLERKSNEATGGSTYRNEFNRGIAGATASLNTGPSSIFIEYYPWVQNTVIYSDEKGSNPFRKNDKLKATGYGLGFTFGFSNESAYQLLYKKLQYRNVTMNGVEISLPSDQYEIMGLDEVTIGFVFRF